MLNMSGKNHAVENVAPELVCIAAVGADGAIGRDGDMPWHLPEDLKHFKATTLGAPIVMGRSTWESLPRRPLPGRLNIVVSRNEDYHADGAIVAGSIEAAMRLVAPAPRIFIIGGASVYEAAMPLASKLIITEIDTLTPDADTFFPVIPHEEWEQTDLSGPFTSESGLQYSFKTYTRRKQG